MHDICYIYVAGENVFICVLLLANSVLLVQLIFRVPIICV